MPEKEVFSVVTCYACGMVLKPQALTEHIEKRHSGQNVLLNDDEVSQKVESKPKETEIVVEQKVKRQKLDLNRNIESFPLGYPPEMLFEKPKMLPKKPEKSFVPSFPLQRTQSFHQVPKTPQQNLQASQSFTLPNPPKQRVAHQPKKPEPLKLKMKLKKVEQGHWSVV